MPQIIDATSGGVNKGPYFIEVVDTWESGKGVVRTGKAYYLNEDAAAVVLQRLRTPKAIEAQKAMARVWVAVSTGEITGSDDGFTRAINSIEASTVAILKLCTNLSVGQTDLTASVDSIKEKQTEWWQASRFFRAVRLLLTPGRWRRQ